MILKKHQNQLLAIIQESGLDTHLFGAEDGSIQNSKFFIVTLRDSPIRFAVKPYESSFEEFYYRRSQFGSSYPLSKSYYARNWASLTNEFKDWLKDVVQPYLDEISAPNMSAFFLSLLI